MTSSEWNVDSLQNARYLQELVAGTNADKIPASALAATLALGTVTAASYGAVSATTGTFSGVLTASSNLAVTGTSTLAGVTATTGSFSGALTASAGLTVSGGPITGSGGLTISSGTSALQVLTATTGSFSSTLAVSGAASIGGSLTLTGQTRTSTGTLLDTGQSFSTPASPAGVFYMSINGVAGYVPYYLM
ncbi:MAG TPA: hypothetical protein VIU62_06030 [Chloroflexota bacterium]